MRKLLQIAAIIAFTVGGMSACGEDPCAKLEHRVCKERLDKTRCKLIKDPKRREHLSGEACEEILKALKR